VKAADPGLEPLAELLAVWRERARRARPLETGVVSAEKRARTQEWMWFTNRANELEAALEKCTPGTKPHTKRTPNRTPRGSRRGRISEVV
jgi:hypothetical protein